jgi:precorrin-3B C17-methyltransferase
VTRTGSLFVVGLGPGERALMSAQALDALRRAEVVVGYSGYFEWVADLVHGKECLALPLSQEVERARLAVRRAEEGATVCVISSGDAGIYGMASLVLETLEGVQERQRPEVVIVPGISAVNACAALAGAPLGHDFAVISLSDLLTPWPLIERRLRAASAADFVLALLNPQSQRRDWQYRRAQEILLENRSPDTPVAVVRQAYRPDQTVTITNVAHMNEPKIDMFTTVLIGNSCTRRFGDLLVTPRGYPLGSERDAP